MSVKGKLWNINNQVLRSPDEQSPNLFRQYAKTVRETIQRLATNSTLKANLEVHQARLQDRIEKVAAVQEWLEELIVCSALGIACQDTAPIMEQLEAEVARRDWHAVVIAGIENEVARRQAKQSGGGA